MVFVWDGIRTASARFALLQADLSRSSLPNRVVRGRGREFQVSDGGCSVTAPLGCDVMMTDDKCEWLLFYLACREREHIAIYALRAPPSRQCRIVTLHAGR